jgi:hypothetical protein
MGSVLLKAAVEEPDSPMRVSDYLTSLSLLLQRQDTKFLNLNLKRLHARNLKSTKPVLSPDGPVVSMTTFGERLGTAYLALESIAAGSLLPRRLILWVDNETVFRNLPDSIGRLVTRGLEVRLSENFGPHTKYYPYLLSSDAFDCPLVTADDDVLYCNWWLSGLSTAHTRNSQVVNCYRAHVIGISDERILPYESWTPCTTTAPNFRNFATGVSGCIYPINLLNRLKHAGDVFRGSCPNGDDIWLHLNALRGGLKVKQILSRPIRFAAIPGTQKSGLFHSNVGLRRNDDQVANTYTPREIALLTKSEPVMRSVIEYKSTT